MTFPRPDWRKALIGAGIAICLWQAVAVAVRLLAEARAQQARSRHEAVQLAWETFQVSEALHDYAAGHDLAGALDVAR